MLKWSRLRILLLLSYLGGRCLAMFPARVHMNMNDDHLMFDYTQPEYETVLSPQDFERAAQLQDSIRYSNSDIWDSDAMYSRSRFEGDIANENLNASTVEWFLTGGVDGNSDPHNFRNAIKNRHQLWPNGRIPYTLSSQYSSYSRSLIASAMQDYTSHTCIQWVPKQASDVNYVYIYPDRGCYSMVGKMGGKQSLSLGSGCIQKGIIIHELMHAVGFFHEQSRTDRDDYITIMWNNIQPGMQGQFEKYGQSTIQSLGTSYDYGSIMHYGSKAFSRNGQPTMIPKQNGAQIGQRGGFSKVDMYKINKLYGCPTDGSTSPPTQTTISITQPPTFTTAPPTNKPVYPSPPTSLPTINPTDCKNTRGDCDDLAKQGWCTRNPGWMRSYCPISCGFCIPTTTQATTQSPTTTKAPQPQTIPTAPTLPPYPTVGVTLPPPSTGIPSDCEDLRVDCLVLVAQRYCKLAQNFMKTYCAKSCGFCYKPPPTEIPPSGTLPSVGPTLVTSPNVVTFAPQTTMSPTTRARPTYPTTTTTTTQPPTPPVTLTSVTPSGCVDKKHFCVHWKNAGFCEGIFMNYMKKNCPKSCGLC